MMTLTRILAVGLTLAIAACATTPPPAVDLTPPAPRAADAKTQLESEEVLSLLQPHPEEPRSGVSKEDPESTGNALVLRDGLTASSG